MRGIALIQRRQAGFSLIELTLVVAAGIILLTAAVPAVRTMWSQYGLVLAAQSVAAQLQYARMKSVSSNESFRVSFPAGGNTYRVETAAGALLAGPFFLPNGVTWNEVDTGGGNSFPGGFVSFLPTGNIPLNGNGSAGRVKLIGPSGYRIDIVVNSGGIIRQTSPYKHPPAPF